MRFEPAPEAPLGFWADFWAPFAEWWTVNSPNILGNILQIVLIVGLALLIRWALHFAIDRIVKRIVTGVKKKQDVTDTQALQASPLAAVRVVQRTRTLGSVLTNIVNIVIVTVVVFQVVGVLAPNVLGSFTFLSAAIGAGLGFGAQNIVRDTLNGLFMIVEDQVGVGDVVDLGPATGIVEEVKIRITKIRDVNGTMWFVRNGEIARVGNMSQGWARVILDVAVPYESDIEAVETTLLATATELWQSTKWRSRILQKPELWGLEAIIDGALMIRLVITVRTTSKDDVARELRTRIKHALDAMELQMPNLNAVVLTGFDGASRVKGAKPPRTEPNTIVPGRADGASKKEKAARRGAPSMTTEQVKSPRPNRAPKTPPPPAGGAPE
ncbi:mechanosensitive ion channel [Agromyces protaetiae]|uniref:Mechanosensitive ion channel n=1 Tax=Agromyces protaetiae TaxID=2509455 RepID=A0A4P6FTG3_9MICO|nr:mechanosensitive ion channel domain-containing protein [Agromyces protaetiae]QAY73848.1 mechanosensitive ion channel [Agromyces protaetiae]